MIQILHYGCRVWPEPKALISWGPTQSWPHGLFDFKESLVVSGLISPQFLREEKKDQEGVEEEDQVLIMAVASAAET